MSNTEWLVAFDTDRIKQYLFSTNKLKEIRGASALLVELNEENEGHLGQTEEVARDNCPQLETVYAGGGGALFITPSETDAQKVIAAVEKLYRQRTAVASITGECLPLAPATRQQGFGSRVQDVMHLVKRNKARKAEMPLLPVEFYFHICDACGQHPAASRQRDEEGRDRLVCRACLIKHRSVPGDWRREPNDFEQLGALSKPFGYLGFLYADGNQMGSRLSALATTEAYTHFSRGVRDLLKNAIGRAVRIQGLRHDLIPCIELLLGGDDLLLVTTADLALPIAIEMARLFEHNSRQLLMEVGLPVDPPLTLAIGVVLAHVDYPIAEFHRVSELRLHSAKRRCFELGYATGAIDFEVITSAVGHEDERPYHNKRPYPLSELDMLLDHARKFKDVSFPTSQLQTMYESLYLPKNIATLASIAALARMRSQPRKAMRDFFLWSGSLALHHLPPWSVPTFPSDKSPLTAMGDLVEIYPFT